VRHLILRGVFLGQKSELDWFYGGGAGRFWPEAWARFADLIPEQEQDDLIAAYGARLFSGDLMQETRYARAWAVGRMPWRRLTQRESPENPHRNMPAPSRGLKTTIFQTSCF